VSKAKMQHCFNCGKELGVYQAYYGDIQACGAHECYRLSAMLIERKPNACVTKPNGIVMNDTVKRSDTPEERSDRMRLIDMLEKAPVGWIPAVGDIYAIVLKPGERDLIVAHLKAVEAHQSETGEINANAETVRLDWQRKPYAAPQANKGSNNGSPVPCPAGAAPVQSNDKKLCATDLRLDAEQIVKDYAGLECGEARVAQAYLDLIAEPSSTVAPLPDHFEGPGTLAAALKPNARYLKAALPEKYHHYFDNVLLPLAQRGAESMRPAEHSATPDPDVKRVLLAAREHVQQRHDYCRREGYWWSSDSMASLLKEIDALIQTRYVHDGNSK
jgi:hypothetical protein